MTEDRRQTARAVRIEAAEKAASRPHPEHRANGDEQRYADANFAMSFTKGLKHDPDTGVLAVADDFRLFREAIDTAFIDPFTAEVPVPRQAIDPCDGATRRRKWEAPTAGVVYDLEGPDAQAVTMPPAPALSDPATRDELAYEMAEVYELARLRDVHFGAFQSKEVPTVSIPAADVGVLADALTHLNDHRYAKCGYRGRPRIVRRHLDPDRPNDLDANPCAPVEITPQEAFRGSSPGVEAGPYLSQFMLIGNPDRDGSGGGVADGYIEYGALRIDQRVAKAVPGRDYMTTKPTWLHVQDGFGPSEGANAGDADDAEFVPGARRFITTPRDLATYVHFDALYEAYLNACLILLSMGTPLDPGFGALSGETPLGVNAPGLPFGTLDDPAARPTIERTAGGFALYGGPHILTLVTEVATRGLKAVRYQKFNNHIRLRPEALAGRIACRPTFAGRFPGFARDLEKLESTIQATLGAVEGTFGSKFLPMAFPEGSPMHPAYGAGHATVAGACVTVLKAFFDTDAVLVSRDDPCAPKERGKGRRKKEAPRKLVGFFRRQDGDEPVAFVPDATGTTLVPCPVEEPLTLEGELNKLAANISIGRNMAGVHYFSDYYDSLRMGEEIAIEILKEQALCYRTDPFVLSLPTFNGAVWRLGAR